MIGEIQDGKQFEITPLKPQKVLRCDRCRLLATEFVKFEGRALPSCGAHMCRTVMQQRLKPPTD